MDSNYPNDVFNPEKIMTRPQQIALAVAELGMASALAYTGFKVYQRNKFGDIPSLLVTYGASAYLLYGAYINAQGRLQLLPKK